MKNIFKTIALILGFLCFWYLLFFLLSCFYPDDNTGEVNKTIFQTQGTRALFGSWKRPSSGRRIFLLGASNVQADFNPYVLEHLSGNNVVYDMTGGSANVTYMQDAFNIAQIVGEPLQGSYVVIGLWYGSFCEDRKLLAAGAKEGSTTSIRTEALRYGLYKLNGNRIELAVDRKFMPVAVTLLRPFLFCQFIMLDIFEKYNDFWGLVHRGFKKDPLHESNFSTQQYRQALINEHARRFGNVEQYSYDEQGLKLKDLCKTIVASGARLIIVDIPLPQWHRDGSFYYKQYLVKKPEYLWEVVKLPGVQYLDFSSQFPDAYFPDGVHSTEAGSWQLSRKLLDAMGH